MKEDGSIQRKFTILTKPAGPQTSGIHDRMPVLLNEAEEKDWLDSSLPPEASLTKFLSDPEPPLNIFSISPKINKSFENDPALLLPTPYAVFEQLSLF
jgi:putative SOS response-associated peptidase YedK